MSRWRISLAFLFTCACTCSIASAQSAPALAVDNASNRNPINPDIYGIDDYADTGLADILPVGARRWGGDATSRYSWKLDTFNSGNDYYFENQPSAPSPAGSTFNTFVEKGLTTGTLRLGTIPVMGWMPNGSNELCSFSIAKYGAQQSFDQYRTDCGNGVLTNGNDVKNDPTDANAPSTQAFQQQWIQSVMAKYGSAQRGGVQVWSLDNEPEWWYAVHRDIHPATSTYDEMLADHQAYAAMIKQTDPTALVTGPVAAGWSGYFYSATDFVNGWSTPPYRFYDNPIDRNAHGGTAWMDYYLQNMAAYEQQNGVRILDYLDLHAYLAPSNISFEDNAGQQITLTNPANEPIPGTFDADTLRLTSTRVFWDPAYVSPDMGTWDACCPTGEPPYIVPRMLQWVAADYPGTKTAITEYNWGATNDITGAIAQADILGIFGREGLDLGAMWAPPTTNPNQPAVYAFAMYLNYDGLGSRFGETSVSATTENPDTISIFAAQRDDNALTIMVLNKSTADLSAPIPVANFQAAGNAQVFQYSAANLNAIQQLSDLQLSSGVVNATFPARSITLLVLPAEPSSLPVPQPVILAVGSSASYATNAVSPGEIVAIFGTNLGPATLAGSQLTPDGGYFAQSTGNVSVSFNGYPAAMVYAVAGQLAAVVPYEAALAQTAAVTVEVQGVRSAPFMVPVAAAVPAIFTADASGHGQGAIQNQDLTLNSSLNPATRGQVIVIYATGEGQTTPPGVDGRIQYDVKSAPVGACSVSIGGKSATVDYCAFAPYEVSGVLQINAVVPTGISTGNVPVSFSIGGVSSPAGVTVAVK
jgi:uncharacterized protein (TIGR03437 family)